MRIDLITETYPPEVNGVAMTLSRLAAELRRRGHGVRVIRPRQRRERGASAPPDKDMLVPGVPIPLYPGMRVGAPAARRLLRAWKENAPDVVHVATEGPLGWSAMRAAARLDIPAVTSFHTNFHEYASDYGLGFLRRACVAYLRSVHGRGRCMLAPDPGLIRDLEGHGFARARLFGRGVDTELFTPARRDPALRAAWGVERSDPVILHVSRVAREKSIPVVLDTFRRVIRPRHPRARMVVVGDGPERRRLQRRYAEVRFTGMLRGEDLARHYASADVFLFASRSETFGNVVTEALASGLIVVAYDYAAARQFIRHGGNGLLAPCFDAGRLQTEALRACGLNGSGGALRSAARAAAENIPWSRAVDQYEAAVAEALAPIVN